MENQADYSEYRCPYDHIRKDSGHELHGPEGYEDTYGVWCACGFRGPVFCLDPNDLRLRRKGEVSTVGRTELDARWDEYIEQCRKRPAAIRGDDGCNS